ncbi:hypothetical protein D9758_011463 [Tetrapyrgos nigripes]|uniref:Het-C-domain-containing protein n=1 Tax=Tetrapyrgos nigripes TaxID=182062 RepID=A0A8H5CQS9_9AGAR|nr:hypothetical protein D9758_011463 [Tetrapyrgos nigripes]
MHRSQGRKQDEYEAYRLLGQALHTLEDFSAHSNFCELALISMGHSNVFPHVGDQVRIQAHNGKWVAPLVTGTFGSSDFIHSLLGEATDHLSEASVSDLNKQLDKARSSDQARSGPGGGGPTSALRTLFSSIPGGEGNEMSRDMDSIERIRAGPAQGGKRPEDMSPQELHAVLWQVLSFRDSVVKKIEKTIEKIPGLGSLIEKLMDSISVFVFTTLEPFLKPLLQSATGGLQTVSGEVIDNHDQYEVFNDPRASDPTHSFLSKDHFNLILNEPAGQIARVVVSHAVGLVVKAWDDSSVNVHQVTEDILSCLFHPDFHDSNSKIQREMMQSMHNWIQHLGGKQHEVLNRLTKDAVRNHKNIRLGGEGGVPEAQGSYAYNQGIQAQHNLQGYLGQIPGVSQAQSLLGGGQGGRREMPGSDMPDFPGANTHGPGHGHGHGPPHGASPILSSGEASSYYGGNNPSGPPSFPSTPGHSSYAAPSGPPPSFPGTGHDGYNPAYSSPPSFPSAQPDGAGWGGGYAPPPGPLGPGGFAPSSGPPGFPGASPYGGPPGGTPGFPDAQPHHHHHHHQHHQPGYPGSGYGGGPPGWQ